MSVDTYVFLRDENLPTVREWQSALDRANTGIVLDLIDDLRTHMGYLPAQYQGEESGFEWYYGPLAECFGGVPPEGLGDRGHVINLVLHSDMRELACAMVSGAVLATIASGLVYDEESGSVISGDMALTAARSIADNLK